MTGVHKTALATTFLIAVLAGWYAVPEAQGPPQPPPGQERRRYVVEFNQVGPGAAAAVRTAGGDVAHGLRLAHHADPCRRGWDRHETPCLTVNRLVFFHFTAGGDDVKLADVTAENWRFQAQAWRERAVSKDF